MVEILTLRSLCPPMLVMLIVSAATPRMLERESLKIFWTAEVNCVTVIPTRLTVAETRTCGTVGAGVGTAVGGAVGVVVGAGVAGATGVDGVVEGVGVGADDGSPKAVEYEGHPSA